MDVVAELRRLGSEVAHLLWSVHGLEEPRRTRLLFPVGRLDEESLARISEQESKVLFCQVLEASGWYYSVETPTRAAYQQRGQTPMAALLDLTMYQAPDARVRAANIELKAHTATGESFRKDLEKLIREGLPGLWFHTLKNADRRTLPTIFKKVQSAVESLEGYLVGEKHVIVFVFCVLERRELYIAELHMDGDARSRIDACRALFTSGADGSPASPAWTRHGGPVALPPAPGPIRPRPVAGPPQGFGGCRVPTSAVVTNRSVLRWNRDGFHLHLRNVDRFSATDFLALLSAFRSAPGRNRESLVVDLERWAADPTRRLHERTCRRLLGWVVTTGNACADSAPAAYDVWRFLFGSPAPTWYPLIGTSGLRERDVRQWEAWFQSLGAPAGDDRAAQ